MINKFSIVQFLSMMVCTLLMVPFANASPTSLTYDGAVYTLTDTQLGTNHYQFTLTVNDSGINDNAAYLNSLAFSFGTNIWNSNTNSFITGDSFSLVSAAGGAANWNTLLGGLNATGCNGSGVPWVCIQFNNGYNGYGYGITPYSSHSNDKYVFDFTGVPLTSSGLDLKANYVDANGNKVGCLISAYISPVSPVSPVPEPRGYAMLLVGLGLIGFVKYHRKGDSSQTMMAA